MSYPADVGDVSKVAKVGSGLNDRTDILVIGEVGFDRFDCSVSAYLRCQRGRLFHPIGINVGADDSQAVSSERHRCRLANSRSCTGHESSRLLGKPWLIHDEEVLPAQLW